MPHESLLTTARTIALRAGELARLRRSEGVAVAASKSSPVDIVTEADRETEALIRGLLADERPGDGFFGEESGSEDRGSRRWILDPIDGTANFMRGVPNWATLIALEVDGVVAMGVVSMPAMGARWFAETGGGAWRQDHGADPRRISVSAVRELADASLSFQSIDQWRRAGYLNPLLALQEQVWRDRAYGDSWSYMLLAEGLVDIVAEFDVKAYDLAAHVPIVREAGGRFTDIEGAETAWNGSSLASNGVLHEAAIAVVASAR